MLLRLCRVDGDFWNDIGGIVLGGGGKVVKFLGNKFLFLFRNFFFIMFLFFMNLLSFVREFLLCSLFIVWIMFSCFFINGFILWWERGGILSDFGILGWEVFFFLFNMYCFLSIICLFESWGILFVFVLFRVLLFVCGSGVLVCYVNFIILKWFLFLIVLFIVGWRKI